MRLKGMAEAAMTPVVVTIGDEQVEVPLFTIRDFIRWGQIVDDERVNTMTKDLEPFQKAQILGFYKLIPSDVGDLRQRVQSPKGMVYVINTCYRKATVIGRVVKGDDGKESIVPSNTPKAFDPGQNVGTDQDPHITYPKIEALIANNDNLELVNHALTLAGVPVIMPDPKKKKGDNGDDQDGGDDPLTRPGTRSSSERPVIGT